jgi:hypothetical protein
LSAMPAALAFEDFPPGEIVEFAREFDPQPFHIDEGAARAAERSGRVSKSREGNPNPRGRKAKPKETKSKSGERKSKRKGKQNVSFFSPVIETLQRLKPRLEEHAVLSSSARPFNYASKSNSMGRRRLVVRRDSDPGIRRQQA